MAPSDIEGEWMVQIQQPMLVIRPEDIVRGYVDSRDVEMAVTEYLGLADQESENLGDVVPSWRPIW